MHAPSRRVVSQRWIAGAVVAALVPIVVYCSAAGT